MNNQASPYFVWFDTEFTGLDVNEARLLQVAALITDIDGLPTSPDDRGINLAIRLDPSTPISEWVETNLAGLLAACRSENAVDIAEAQRQLCAYVDRVAGPRNDDIRLRPVLGGNSLHMDWALACRDLPEFIDRLHYRHMDVTALKLLWETGFKQPEFDKDNEADMRAYLPFEPGPSIGQAHDAMYDVLASIAELQFYRQRLQIAP